MEQLIIACDLN